MSKKKSGQSQTKRKVGRPTKYSETTCLEVMKLIEKMTASNFWDYCEMDSIAYHLGVGSKHTLYDWMKIYPEFSHAITKWRTKRDMLFWKVEMRDVLRIFLSKIWFGYRDEKDLTIHESRKEISLVFSYEGEENQEETENEE